MLRVSEVGDRQSCQGTVTFMGVAVSHCGLQMWHSVGTERVGTLVSLKKSYVTMAASQNSAVLCHQAREHMEPLETFRGRDGALPWTRI